jgi:phospholipase C
MNDAQAGQLPQVAFIDANIGETISGPGVADQLNDEHPPGDIQVGQKFTSDVVQALFASPQWKSSVLFLTYDEHGGIYDHLPPPPACAPDDRAPVFTNSEDAQYPGGFDRYGIRVPFTAVSPYTKKGYVSHHVYDHTSMTRFIEAKFKLPALTARDANADALMDFFDFQNPPFMTPPQIAPATVDPDGVMQCQNWFGPPPSGN